MKVTLHKKENLVEFGNLAEGDCFYYNDLPFMKVYCPSEPARAINLSSYKLTYMTNETQVMIVDAELILTKC